MPGFGPSGGVEDAGEGDRDAPTGPSCRRICIEIIYSD